MLQPKKIVLIIILIFYILFGIGICMITEGVIPIVAVDPVRVILSCSVGSAVGGALIMILNVGSMVPSGGMFISWG